ncbi:hypothetical protein KABACHOK_02480 [Brevundimonas phage vB_BpoS-Kabachok]|uniref:Uncharacterized protein n=1 Tax=Brevundimonas phage vB_BpoS-Kabachok TaxID=2948600 RepID=A0A9E7MPN6_9CAUD|nr:hypothetical protein KABACHOK_02480 [Brevundimonas phage vB_BpoS-Kabachok]
MSDRFLLPRMTRDLFEQSPFFEHPDCPFKGSFHDGDPRVVVITGENASGKSLVFRILAGTLQQEKITAVTLSIRERTGGGSFEMARMRRAFIYGDEEEQSTGATSARVVRSGFKNAGREGDAGVLMLDEPEMGLSDGYARALGELIGVKARTAEADGGMNDACHGVVVVSHNRPLVHGLIQGLRASPTFVNMSPAPVDLNDWLSTPERRTIAELEALSETAGERRKITHRVIAALKNNKDD